LSYELKLLFKVMPFIFISETLVYLTLFADKPNYLE